MKSMKVDYQNVLNNLFLDWKHLNGYFGIKQHFNRVRLNCLVKPNRSSGKEIQYFFNFIVCSFMENSIGLKRYNPLGNMR